jgi:hypothetical protein
MPAPRYARPSPRAATFGRSLLVEALLLAAILALAFAPRFVQGQTALAWTRFHVGMASRVNRPGEHVRQAGHWAAQALEEAAPLPVGAEAARLALSLGPAIEERDRVAALTMYTQVRAELQRLRASRWRGLGLHGLAVEADRRAEAARRRGPSDAP